VLKDEEVTYELVMSEDADAVKNMISTSSPIGRALLGKEVGDAVKVTSPGGLKELEIVQLITVHDMAS
jgi:transcription elongation factor GreA